MIPHYHYRKISIIVGGKVYTVPVQSELRYRVLFFAEVALHFGHICIFEAPTCWMQPRSCVKTSIISFSRQHKKAVLRIRIRKNPELFDGSESEFKFELGFGSNQQIMSLRRYNFIGTSS
jgi:hypothetical protein